MGCCHQPGRSSLDYQNSLPESTKKKIILSASEFITIKSTPLAEDYKIQGLISRRSTAQVQKAIHIPTNTLRAIKSFPLPSDQLLLSTLLQEISILKRLDHPGIVKVFEIYRNASKIFIVTELCTGGELFDRIKEMKKFSENTAARCVKELAGALMHCHQQGVVHRNIKPENILFENSDKDAKLKLIDFGTSLLYQTSEEVSMNYYMPPEHFTGKTCQKSDVWSLGIVLYILLSGSPPFTGKTPEDLIENIKNSQLSFTHHNWSTISNEAKDLLRKMLNKNPKTRASIEEVLHNYWVKLRSCDLIPDKQIQEAALNSLFSFKAESHLQKTVFAYIISQRPISENFSKLRDVFISIDKNGDGLLSAEELQMAVIENKLQIDVEKIIDECDMDKNGFIDYTEFLIATVDRSQAYSKERVKEVFDAFDVNKDGKIDLNELRTVLSGGDRQRISLVGQIFEEADMNGDGEIDFEEFLQCLKL